MKKQQYHHNYWFICIHFTNTNTALCCSQTDTAFMSGNKINFTSLVQDQFLLVLVKGMLQQYLVLVIVISQPFSFSTVIKILALVLVQLLKN